MGWRYYDEARDVAAVQRIWREIGWSDGSDEQNTAVAGFYRVGTAVVAEIDGTAECAVHRTPGSIRYLDRDLSMGAVTAVTTSHVARKQSFASELTAESLAAINDEGAAVASLGIFEQGFYDRFGFGTGVYNHRITYDPATFTVPFPDRAPVRVGLEHAADLHSLLARRHRGHGAVVLDPPGIMEAELGWTEKRFGIGFRAVDGRLTHALVGSMESDKHYRVDWLAYEEPGQLLELLGVLKGLGDQLVAVTFSFEPAEIQLQDLVDRPIRQRNKAAPGPSAPSAHHALAWHQFRIVDLPACVAASSWPGRPLEFDLVLTDPLAERGGRWAGVGGEWHVRIGTESEAVPGATRGPVLHATVNAFTRLWLGSRPASSLALTGGMSGPAELLTALDRVFCLPRAVPGWMF